MIYNSVQDHSHYHTGEPTLEQDGKQDRTDLL